MRNLGRSRLPAGEHATRRAADGAPPDNSKIAVITSDNIQLSEPKYQSQNLARRVREFSSRLDAGARRRTSVAYSSRPRLGFCWRCASPITGSWTSFVPSSCEVFDLGVVRVLRAV